MPIPFLPILGLGMQISGHRKEKRARKRAEAAARAAAEDTAKQYEAKAGDERAIGSYKVEEQQHEGRLIKSRAKALGAASGAGGYEGSLAEIDAEAEYRTMFAMFNGEKSARDLELAAVATRKHGIDAANAIKEQGRARDIENYVGMFSSAQSLYDRFGRSGNPGKV